MQRFETRPTVILRIVLVIASFVFSIGSKAEQNQATSSRARECQALLQAQKSSEKESSKFRFFADTIKQEGKISRTELRSPQNKATYLSALLRAKNLSFIDLKYLDLISEDPKNQKILKRLETFDFESPEASENLLQLLRDLREIARKSTTWREQMDGLKNRLVGSSGQVLLSDATDLVVTKESIEHYLLDNLGSSVEARQKSRLSHFINGSFLVLKPMASAYLATWMMDFPIWLHRSRSLEDLNGKTLTDPNSLKVKRNLWIDLTTDKLRRVTLVAMVLIRSTGLVLDFDGNLFDFGKRAWTELNSAVVLTEAYATYDAEKPGMDPTRLARSMNTPEYARWEAEYQEKYKQKPDPENNAVDLLMWKAEGR